MTPPARRTGRRRLPLSTRLSVFLALVVVAAVLLVVASSGIAMRSWMTGQMDQQLQQSLFRAQKLDGDGDGEIGPNSGGGTGTAPSGATGAESSAPTGGSSGSAGTSGSTGSADSVDQSGSVPPDHGVPSALGGPGSAEGQLQLIERDGVVVSGLVKNFAVASLSDENLAILRSVSTSGRGETVHLRGLGDFRVRATMLSNGTRIVVGQSTEQIDRTALALMGVGGGLGAIVVVIAVVFGRRWIVREMAPLGKVAATARGIGQTDLEVGAIEPFDRVAPEDAPAGTEVGDVGTALNAMIDNVESALTARAESEKRLRQFVADASHELRTPLASIQGYTQLLQRESIESDLALSRISSESKRMSVLVEDLLLLARLDAGRELESKPVDVVPLAIDAVSDAHAAGPDHEWVLDVPMGDEDGAGFDACEVLGDESALRQVLANLVNNARVHTPAGTRVVVGVAAIPVAESDVLRDKTGERSWRAGVGPAGSVRIRVADNGPGIPEELRSTVFDRFVRGDSSRTRSGSGSSGLGLSIVSSIVGALGGRVEMSTSEAGTTFDVYVPRLSELG